MGKFFSWYSRLGQNSRIARQELDLLLNLSEWRERPMVVFRNKVDKSGALKEEEFRELMRL